MIKQSRVAIQRAEKLSHTIKHPAITVPLATFAVLIMVSVLAIIMLGVGGPKLKAADTRTAIVSHDGQEQTVPTRAKTVGELLDRLEVKLGEGDVVEPAQDAEITTDNFRVNVYRGSPVTIVDDERKTFTFSAAATPRSVVKQAGVEVHPEDRLENIPTNNFLIEGSIGPRVVIDRATPVHINIYGTPTVLRTHAQTVGELLEERNINLGESDSVEPARSAAIEPDMQIFLLQKGTQIATVEEEIPMPVEEVEDDSLSFGATAIRQEGSPGKRVVTYKIQLENGKEVDRQETQSVVVQEPVKQIVAKGRLTNIPADRVGVMAAAGINPSDYQYVDYIFMRESNWNAAARSSNGCIGLGQNCPPNYWLIDACSNWQNDPVCQTKRFAAYAEGRYGSWAAAYNFWLANHWW